MGPASPDIEFCMVTHVTQEASHSLHTLAMNSDTQPELMVGYDPDGTISGAVCSLCGERMLDPDPPFRNTRDAISAFSIAFGYHIRLKHAEFIPN
jgi:hypothetical protein